MIVADDRKYSLKYIIDNDITSAVRLLRQRRHAFITVVTTHNAYEFQVC